jgi:hypothetical protein
MIAALGELRRSSGSAAASMPFIISSNIDKADPATRKLIRSHVMQGKKHRIARSDKKQRMNSSRIRGSHTQAERVLMEDLVGLYTKVPLIPGRIGSDISFLEFAIDIEPSILLNMIKGLSLNVNLR